MISKKLICVALICTWGLAGGAQADLIGRWTFDDAANLGADSSGTGNDGTVEGDATFSSDAVVGAGALLLDGTDDYINVGLGTNDMLADWSIDLSVTAWAKPDNLARQWNCFFGHALQNNGIKFELMGGGYRFTTLAVQDYDLPLSLEADEWFHAAATLDSTGVTFYVNGEEAGQVAGGAPALTATGQYNVGYGGFWEPEQFQGLLDEVRIYDHVLTVDEVARVMVDRGGPYPWAFDHRPKEGTMIAAVTTTLTWRAGDFAASHDVYLGESLDEVSQATPESDAFQGNVTVTEFELTNLTPGQTYYWRVDEINEANPDSPWKGEVWSFWVQPGIAWEPVPADGTPYLFLDPVLSWNKGLGALLHTVYFGESFDEVNDTTVYTTMTPDASFAPAPLEIGKTYYWRVDEFISPLQTNKGDVWSFTTLPQIEVSDPNLLALWTLDEGVGSNVLDWSGHGHHGTLGGDARWQEGYFDSALYFDGLGDYVDLGTPADLHLTQNYTYTAWFKVGQNINGDSGPQYLLCIGSRSDLVFGVEDGVGVDGDLSLHYYDTEPGFHAVGVGKTDWRADEWHMVAGTRDEEGHKIYLDGELRNSDTNVNADNFGGAMTRMISLGGRAWTGHQFYHGLIDEVRIYNRALSAEEIQVLMRGDPLLAWNPDPQRGALVDIRDAATLRWQAGDMAASHDVYLGQDKDAVAAAGTDAPQYQGNQPGTSFPLAGRVEFGGGDYYWRIDEVQADGTVHKGRIWKFSIPAYLIVDNFESYTNFSPDRVFQTWVDGLGFSGDEFFPDGDPGNGTGALVGHDIWSLDSPHYGKTIVETGNVHGGGQAMPLYYDNTTAPYRSEAVRTWATPQDWTVEDVTDLTLFVRGEAANAPDPLYIVIEDSGGRSGVATHPDAAILTIAEWTPWNIPLSNFADAGVTLTAVKKMVLGVGSRDGSTPGGTGVVYFDDIWLTQGAAE